MMIPRIVFQLAKPQSNLIKLQTSPIKNLNNDIFAAIIACIRLHQKQI